LFITNLQSGIESGGFSEAEVDLNISRLAISLAISELESLIMMKLCHRGCSRLSITEQGEEIYQLALELLESIENFRSKMNGINTNLVGELNISITDNLMASE
jgi:DNA-binding transcriptional LysR family regulator